MVATSTLGCSDSRPAFPLLVQARTRALRSVRRCALGLAVAITAAIAPVTGEAAILAAQSTVQPAATVIPIGQASSIVINWTVVNVIVGFPGGIPYTVTSTSGQFVAGGTVLGTVNTVLSASGVNTGVPSSVRMSESFIIPPDVTVKANQLGATSIAFVRQFNDGAGPVPLQASLFIGGSAAAQFNIFREALSFDDGSVVRVVQRGDPLTAAAEINFSGGGSMSAVWEVAGPESTPGQPIFRQLQTVTRGLLGSDAAILRSPSLPTDSNGVYLLRLRITNPPLGFEPPQLSYYVGDARSGVLGGITPMLLRGPADGGFLDRDTRFAWQPVEGAKAYKVEVFAVPGSDAYDLPDLGALAEGTDLKRARAALASPPISGMVLTASQTTVPLSALSRAKLRPGGRYFWRVQALDPEGRVIGEGRVRQFRVP